jgi:hypothetical protein
MDGHGFGLTVLLATVVPGCTPLMAGLGMVLAGSALFLTGWLLSRLMRAIRAKLGVSDPLDKAGFRPPRGSDLPEPPLPGQTRQEVARRLRHDSPGGWTAGETRWTLAHEHGWFNSPGYRIFLLVILFVTVTWAFGTQFAHQYCG